MALDQIDEHAMVDEVRGQIKSIGDGVGKIKSDYQEMKSRLESFESKYGSRANIPADVKVQIDKLATRVAAMQEHVDLMDVRSRRPMAKGFLQDVSTEEKEEEAFALARLSVKSDEVVTPKQVRDELNTNQDILEVYKLAFDEFLRKGDPQKPNMGFEQPELLKMLYVGSDPAGGYLVIPQMSNRITERIWELDPVRQLAAVETVSTGALEWFVDIDEMDAGWEGETIGGAETATAEWRKKRIPVHVMYAKPRASQTLVEDAAINIENWISRKVGTKFARVEGETFITGDGVGKPRGFTTYANGTNWGQVQQVVVGTVAGTIDADGLIDVKYSLKEDYLGRGTWLMRRGTVAEVMQLKDGMGQYLWKPGLLGEDPLASSLIGLPVRMAPHMPAIAAGANAFALADWDEAYMIVDRIGISVQRDVYTIKPMIEYYTRKRTGGDVMNYEALKLGRVNP